MPTYLCHGFRWHRRSIAVYVIIHNLDDAAPHWVIKQDSSFSILESFYTIFDFLPACAPPGNERLRAHRAWNHTNYYALYNDPAKAAAKDAGMVATGRSRSQSVNRHTIWPGENTTEDDRSSGPDQADSKRITPARDRRHSERERENKQTMYRLTPTRPKRSQSESLAIRSFSHLHFHQNLTLSQAHRHNGSEVLPTPSTPTVVKRTDAPLPPVPAPPEDDKVLVNDWSCVKLLEEYNPDDTELVSAPYAYVADYVVRIDASVSIVEEMAKYEEIQRAGDGAMSGPSDETLGRAEHNKQVKEGGNSSSKAGWFERLRDQLQRQEDIRWYIVVCGDEERNIFGQDDDEEAEEEDPALDPWDRKMRLLEIGRQALAQQREDDDHERRRKMLQIQLGKPTDDDADADEYDDEDEDGDPWAAKMRLMEQEREKRGRQQEKKNRELRQSQVVRPPNVPEKDHPPRRGAGTVMKSKSMDLGHIGRKKNMSPEVHANAGGPSPKPKTRKGNLRRLFSRGRLADDARRGEGHEG